MAFEDPYKFKGITSWKKDAHTNNVLYGVIDFFRWGFLGIGAYQNITQNPAVSGVFGGDRFQLTLDNDPNYTDGQVWRGYKKDWVWESGVNFSPAPIVASGVYFNEVFYETSSTTGAFSHYIDFPRGRVVFDTAVATTGVVKANFSIRSVQVTQADEVGIQEIVHQSHRIERSDFLAATGGGNWSRSLEHLYQLPLLAVEFVDTTFTGYELGGGQLASADLLFYVFADNPDDRNQIIDVIKYQSEKVIWLANRGLIKSSTDYPGGQVSLDFRGSPVDNFLTYPSIVFPSADGGFQWRQCRFGSIDLESSDNLNNELYRAILRVNTEVILNEI